MNKFCSKCGNEISPKVRYCPKCGASVIPEWEMDIRKEIKLVSCSFAGCLTVILAIVSFFFFYWEIPSFIVFIISSLAAVIPCVFYIFLILWLDRHEKEPLYLLASAFIWGALVSTLFASAVNSVFGNIARDFAGKYWGRVLGSVISAPISEETSKGAALLILFLFMRHEFDNVLDGIIYGSLVGLGFAMVEDITYFGRAFKEGGLQTMGWLVISRAILGGLGHSLYTGTTGAGLGFARQTKNVFLKIVVPILAFGFAIAQHSAWNLTCSIVSRYIQAPASIAQNVITMRIFDFLMDFLQTIILSLPGLLILIVIAYFALRQEKKVIKDYLADELKSGAVLQDEYNVLTKGGRLQRELAILTRRGISSWSKLRKLYQLEVDLAFRKWHTSRGEKLKGFQRMYSEDVFRTQIAETRGKL